MVATVGALSVLSSAAQKVPTPTFRSGVRLVEVDVTVRDKDHRFVETLTKDDFEVLEDGVSRRIQQSWVVNLSAGRKTDPALPSATPVLPTLLGSSTDVGRLYVLVLADGGVERIRTIAHQFITEFLGPTDLMAVVHVGSRAATQGLTADRDLLLASVDRYRGGGGPEASLATLKEVAVSLNATTGRRKAVLYIGSGFGLWSPDVGPGGGTPAQVDQGVAALKLSRVFEDVERVAKRNNVRIYPVSPAYVDVGDEVIRTSNTGDGASSLGLLAYDTHGTAVWKMSDLKKIVRDNSAYYLLTYESAAEADGLPHPITVRLRDRPKLSLEQGRLSVTTPTPDAQGRSARMPKGLSAEAKRALTPSTGVVQPTGSDPGIEIFTAVFQATDFNGSILIGTHVPGSSLRLAASDTIELSYVAIDRWGVVRAAQRRAFQLNLGEDRRAEVERTGVRLLGRLQLPRGQYQIRVAAHQTNGITASAATDVEVPDYTDQALTVSEFLVSSSHAPTLMTLEDDAVLRDALPAQPTPGRRFRRGETLTVFAEITDTHWILSQEVGVTATVVADDGRVVFRGDQTLTAANKGRFHLTSVLPLAAFSPGDYRLIVEANTREGIPANTSREMAFTVVEATVPVTTSRVASGAAPGQTFEVVSVRRAVTPSPAFPGAPVPRGEFRMLPDGRVEARGQTLAELARIAYGFEQVDPRGGVVDADQWMWTDRFDVTAATGQPWSTAPSSASVPTELRTMLKAMLEDRFGLQARVGTKKVEVVALRLTKPDTLGPGLRPSLGACRGASSTDAPTDASDGVPSDAATQPAPECRPAFTLGEIDAKALTMTEVAALLSQNPMFKGLGLFVDETGLSGRYDLSFSMRTRGTGRTPYEMLEAQHGVTLKTTRMPLPTLIIERAKKPHAD
jgi:uncharacterized protein (TIGR03435 family)